MSEYNFIVSLGSIQNTKNSEDNHIPLSTGIPFSCLRPPGGIPFVESVDSLHCSYDHRTFSFHTKKCECSHLNNGLNFEVLER